MLNQGAPVGSAQISPKNLPGSPNHRNPQLPTKMDYTCVEISSTALTASCLNKICCDKISLTYKTAFRILNPRKSNFLSIRPCPRCKIETLVRYFSEKMLFKISMLLYAVSLALMPLMPGTWYCIIPAAVMGVAQGIVIPVIQTMPCGLSTTENRAVVLSFYGTSLRVGQTIGPVIMSVVFYFGSVLALAMIVWLILVVDKETTESKEEGK